MKRKLKAIAAVLLVLVMFVSAMPIQLAAEAMTPPTTRYATPDGYNDHDYQKMVAFFEQTDENGVRNGEKLSWDYDPTDPRTWRGYDGDYCRGSIGWTIVAGEYRLYEIFFGGRSNGNDAEPLELVGFLDVSGCTALTEVRCESLGDIQLTGLDVSGCAALEVLYCGGNELTELDVSGCTALTSLDCYENQLTELDISTNTELVWLYCYWNQLTELDVSANAALEGLDCSGNQLTELDISANAALVWLDCSWNQLTELDISTNNTELVLLWCDRNQLTELDVSANAALEVLTCYKNQLTELDVSTNAELYELDCSDNQLTELDISVNTELRRLWCSGNQLTELDLSNNPRIDIDTISAEGSGFIGVGTERDENYEWYCIKAVPVLGNSFCGWYAVDGTLLSTNVEINRNDFDGVNDFIARFTASTPGGVGDVDGDGAVRVSDAVLIMRYALGLIEFTPEQILCGDVDGDGFVKVADAVMVIRIALGLV